MVDRLQVLNGLEEAAATLRRLADDHPGAISSAMQRYAAELHREIAALAIELRAQGLLTDAANQNAAPIATAASRELSAS